MSIIVLGPMLGLESGGPVVGDCIAVGEPFKLTVMMYDIDGIGDPYPGYDDIDWVRWEKRVRPVGGEWGDWEEVFFDGSPTYVGAGRFVSGLSQDGVSGSCDIEYKATVDDVGSPTNDAEVSKTRIVKVRQVDYVIVLPNPTTVSVGGSVGLTGKAYSYGADDERHWDEYGVAIPGRAADDIQNSATFEWLVLGYTLGSVNPTTGVSTTFTANQVGGTCTVTATYDPTGVNVAGSATVDVRGVDSVWIESFNGRSEKFVEVGCDITLKAHAYNNGDDGIPSEDDIELDVVFDWTGNPELGTFNQNPAATTTFTAGLTPGLCTVRATHAGSGEYFEIPLYVVKVDLVGINFDEVQNVPINGLVPTSKDGFNAVGKIKAKVVFESEPGIQHGIWLHANSGKVEFADTFLVVTPNGNGHGEAEIELRAVGTTPSSALEDIELSAELFHPYLGGYSIATTTEDVTVYRFDWDQQLPVAESNPKSYSSSGGAGYDVPEFKCWTGSDAAGVTSHSTMTKRTQLRVLCTPTDAFSGQVSAAARVSFLATYYAMIRKGMDENGNATSLSLSYGPVGVSWSFGGDAERAGVGVAWTVEFETGGATTPGGWHESSENVPNALGFPWDAGWKLDEFNGSDGINPTDIARLYTVDSETGHDLFLTVCIAAETTGEHVIPGTGGASVYSESYIDSDIAFVSIYEDDNVYEIQ